MPNSLRGVLRLLGVLALVALFNPMPYLEAQAGRDFVRCIQACNENRRACDERCKTDCAEMFPNNKVQRNACIDACKATCGEVSADCKAACNVHRVPPTPEEP